MFSNALRETTTTLLERCKEKGLLLATAESCTGGLIAALFTEIPGSSAVFERGVVSYSNASKTALLGVEASLIEAQGAVSEHVAVAMADGMRRRTSVDLVVAVTGIAGPDGGSKEKPVGTVCIAVISEQDTMVETFHFQGDRHSIRMQSVEAALSMLMNIVSRSFSYVA